jgi:hypothetical protein
MPHGPFPEQVKSNAWSATLGFIRPEGRVLEKVCFQ